MNNRPLIDATEAKIISLPEQTQFAPHGIVSRTLLHTPTTRVVLFGFAEGQELSEHTSTSHAIVQILSGECDFSLDGEWKIVKTGEVVYMPPNLKHALKARQKFSMLLTLFKPAEAPPTTVPTNFAFQKV